MTSIIEVLKGDVTEPTAMMDLPGLISDACGMLLYRRLTEEGQARLLAFVDKANALLKELST